MRGSLGNNARPLAAAIVALLFSVPLVFLLLGSLRAAGTPPTGLSLIPAEPTLASYERASELVPLASQTLNSLLVVGIAVPLTVLAASAAGFALAQLPPRSRGLIVVGLLLAMMIPLTAVWIPRFIGFRELGLTNTYVPLIAPALMGSSPFFVLLFYWSVRRLPSNLVEAARLEGLSPFATWRRVVAPLVRPTAFAVAALAFALHWSNFIDALLYLFDPDLWTLPLGMFALRGLGSLEFPVLLAGAAFATLPALVTFLLVQRRIFERVPGGLGWQER